jgi:4-hydroxybenzoate polyprenyltransferase
MKLKSYLKILRPVNLFITFLSVIGAVIIAAKDLQAGFSPDVFLAALAAAMINGAGNVINDFFDVETDKANKKMRPLVTGEITRNGAINYYLILNGAALVILLTISETLFYLGLATVILLFIYSRFLKTFPFIGNATVAFLTGFVFIFGGVLEGHWWRDIFPFLFAFQINLIREIVKDLEDLPGDIANNIITFVYIFEERPTKIFIAVLTAIFVGLTLLPYFCDIYNIEYLLTVLFTVDILLVLFLKYLFAKKPNYRAIHLILKSAMLLGLAAILIGVLL